MAKYKIGEIAASTGISPFTLKYYEEEGLLTPLTNPSTGYRYYDEDELGTVMQIHRHRQWGFSLKDIKTIFQGLDPQQLEGMFSSQIQANAAEIARLQEANRELREQMVWQERFSRLRGGWEIRDLPPFHYLEHYVMSEEERPLLPVPRQMADSLQAFSTAWVPLGKGGPLPGVEPVWGLLRFDREGEALSPLWAEGSRVFSGGPCLIDYYGEPPQPHFDPACLSGALSAAESQGLSLQGDAYCMFLCDTVTGGVLTENYALLLPLKNSSKPS